MHWAQSNCTAKNDSLPHAPVGIAVSPGGPAGTAAYKEDTAQILADVRLRFLPSSPLTCKWKKSPSEAPI